MDIYSQTGIKKILSEKGYFLSKTRGQNYLVNKSIAYRIAEIISEIIGDTNVEVIEVGGGLGSITLPLAEKFQKVISIEIDKGISECLSEVIKEFNLENKVSIINRDFLKIDPSELVQSQTKYIFVSNLPYSVGGEILRKVMYDYNIKDIFVMVQKEFFERITAKPNTKNYSFASIMFQLNTERIKKLLYVDRSNFFPSPSVDSVFLHITKSDNLVDKSTLNFLMRLFSNRRKNILNSISLACKIDKVATRDILDKLGISYSTRVENLSPQDLLSLVQNIKEFQNIHKNAKF